MVEKHASFTAHVGSSANFFVRMASLFLRIHTSFQSFGPGYANASYQSCISVGNFNTQVFPDAYITFTSTNSNLWSSCTFTLSLRDDTAKNTIERTSYNCTPSARANAYRMQYAIGAVSGIRNHMFHTYVSWSANYNGQNISGGTVNSPEVTYS